MRRNTIPVLEIGGTHLTAALVDSDIWKVEPQSRISLPLDADGSADDLIRAFTGAARILEVDLETTWAIAIPGPFDYVKGVGLFEHVGKFDSLRGVDLRRELTCRISPTPSEICFLNDADAFGVGEYVAGAARGSDRAVCITLGTGVGSAFLDRGLPIKSGSLVPPHGSVHLMNFRGKPLEDTVSRRAIRTSYAHSLGTVETAPPDVHEIAMRSRSGESKATTVLREAFEGLGEAIGSTVQEFATDVLVIGGSMARSWDVVEPAVRAGLAKGAPALRQPEIRPAARPDDAAVLGAAYWVSNHAPV